MNTQYFAQKRAPIIETLLAYHGVIRFHMPGHKGGAGADPCAISLLGPKAYLNDVTGVPGLDDLQEPHGCIKEAQELAAQAFGADYTLFSVNGTTGAIHAMVLSRVGEGDTIIIPRNIHKSILAAIVLSGARPVFVPVPYDSYLGISMGCDVDSVKSCAELNRHAKAALLVNPTYYGTAVDLTPIASVLHKKNIPLLVDEAHGPHCRFHPGLPKPALDSDADAVAQGAHKILGAFTQASMLHIKGNRIDRARLKATFQYLTTTSPSYLLLASIDAARRQMALSGRQHLDRAINLAGFLRESVNRIPGLYSFGTEILGRPGLEMLDPTKVTVTVRELGITGYQAEIYLRQNHKIQVELSDIYNLLFIVSFGNTESQVQRLVDALKSLVSAVRRGNIQKSLGSARITIPDLPETPEMRLTPKQAVESLWERVALRDAKDRISAEVVTCYPPGIPITYPGEAITQDTLSYLEVARDLALGISGPEDRTLTTLRVVKQL